MSDDITNAFAAVKATLDFTKTALDVVRGAKSLMPEGADKAAVEDALAQAQASAERADALLAHGLGYHMCKCQFPPTPMLSKGYNSDSREVFECPKCDKGYPPPPRPTPQVNTGRHSN